MARFQVRRLHFGAPGDAAGDDGEGLPTPTRIKLAARRAAGIAEAAAVLAHLPAPGESLHAVCTARLDLTDVINALLERLGRCDRMLVATLGYNEANLRTMLAWLDSGAVRRLSLVASIFFRSHKGDLWTETLKAFRARKHAPSAALPTPRLSPWRLLPAPPCASREAATSVATAAVGSNSP